jgi:predicted PolB exonuclease-like 3'-5' exonuclease
VQFPAYYAGRSGGPDYRYRFSDEGHMDLADVLTDYGASRMPSLTALAQLVGMPGKMDVDGSQVESMFAHGRYTEIRDYCLHDVVQTAFVFLRTELLRGRLTQDQYRARAQSLWTALEQDPRVLPVLQQANKPLALLTN